MKKYILLIVVFFSAAILFKAYANCKDSVKQLKTENNLKETTLNCFVVFNDGTVKSYTSLKLVTGLFVTPHLLADNQIIINAKDIRAYQNTEHYAVSAKALKTSKTGNVASETLPGFAVRVAKGKINVYSRKYYNGSNTVDQYFLQAGDEGEIIAYSSEVMNELVKDNPKVSDYYNNKLKISPKSKKLLATAELYNNSQLLSKN